MADNEKYRFTAKIGDVEEFSFLISPDEEPAYKRAVYHVNDFWRKMRSASQGGSSGQALAKTALAFAELYYRTLEQLARHSQQLDDFEKELDDILLLDKV